MPAQHDWFLSTGDWQTDPQIYVREFGSGPDTIIMLHGGWGGEYSGLLDAVAGFEADYHFIFYDQRGSLRSPFPDSLISFSAHIEDLELLRRALQLEKVSLIGHSMGAILASAYAARYPERTERIILLAPPLLKEPIPPGNEMLFEQHQARLGAFLERPEVGAELDRFDLNRTSPSLSSQEETARFRINLARRMLFDVRRWPGLTGGRALYKGHIFQLTMNTYPAEGWDYPQDFKKQLYQVSIIAGDHDFLDMGNELLKKWVGEVPGLRLEIIPNAGHVLWLDQPEVFADTLREVLEKR